MDVEKIIQFLLEHQARFAADMDVMKEEQRELRTLIGGLQSSVTGLTGSVTALADVVGSLQRQMSEVIGAVRGLAVFTHDLARRQIQTEDNLNVLIKTVDEIVRRDGGRRQDQ